MTPTRRWALLVLLVAGCGAPAPERTWVVPAAAHDTAWGPFEASLGAVAPQTHRGLQQLIRLGLDLVAAQGATRMDQAHWEALLAALLPARFPPGTTVPFGVAGGAPELDLAGTRLRAFGNVVGTFDPARAVLTRLQGPAGTATVASSLDQTGTWQDRLSYSGGPRGLTGWLSASSRVEGAACPSPWLGAAGIAAPLACLGRLTSLRFDGEARPGDRAQDAIRVRAESLEGAATVTVGPIRLPEGWRLRVGVPDLNADVTIRLRAAEEPTSAVQEAAGSLTSVTAAGLERLRFAWRRDASLTIESQGAGLRFVIGGDLPWRIEATRDGSLQARIERFEADPTTRTWRATVVRRDGATRTWPLAPVAWDELPDSPVRGQAADAALDEGTFGAAPRVPGAEDGSKPGLNEGATLP